MSQVEFWKNKFYHYLSSFEFVDSSHDIFHFERVWKVSKNIIDELDEPVDELVILAAAYFHDIVCFAKDDPRRSQSSKHAAIRTTEILTQMDFPKDKISHVADCIESHSFSAGIECKTLEAKIVQDADRMESLGAIGLARTFYVAGLMKSNIFNSKDPFANNREFDDKRFAIDHFFVKLLKLKDTMNTEAAKKIANQRSAILENYLNDLKSELFL
ncbi:MAG: HD domain-containing protein [Bacteriovoracaceae bacterium]|nr:HD domain-containing protein [Bacteriovoracaceae bacterium]